MTNSRPQDLVSDLKECRQNTWETPIDEDTPTRSCVSGWKIGDICWADYKTRGGKISTLYGTIIWIIGDIVTIQVGHSYRQKNIKDIRRTEYAEG